MDLAKTPEETLGRSVVPERKASVLTGKVLLDSFARLNPRSLIANPVMFLVEFTFFIVLAMAIYPQGFYPVASPQPKTILCDSRGDSHSNRVV